MRRVYDGNQAAAQVAYACSEVVAIYPITPASPMGEAADEWSADLVPNLWGQVPKVVEMQSEAGAAGTVHGALQGGCLTTTFTASQGLLLMLPNMFKIAGELTSTVFHIAARSLATHALSIFGDHSDVMAARSTGWGMLFAASVQESQDFAMICQMSTYSSRVPFMHIQDGFRTSHEENDIEVLERATMLELLCEPHLQAHRDRGLTPERPQLRGTAQNPDTFFQGREAANPFYQACPQLVQEAMGSFERATGRGYGLVEYVGHPQAREVLVVMGSACQTVEAVVGAFPDEKWGLLKIRLFRPWPSQAVLDAIPVSVERIAVLDRCREPGAAGEPLFQDVLTTLAEAGRHPLVIGGRYGLGSKEFTPAMVVAIFKELASSHPRRRFTVGIHDDVSRLSLDIGPCLALEDPESVRAVFWGLGSDGTVGANKNTIRIIGEETGAFAQGYFVYDSKKSGARTVSHLRFGPRPIARPYLICRPNFVAVHQFEFVHRFPVLDGIEEDGVVLLNCPHEEVWSHLPADFQRQIQDRKLRLFAVDAYSLARQLGLGGRINTIMQTCFFELSGVLPRVRYLELIKEAIQKSYAHHGMPVIRRNLAAVDASLEGLKRVHPGLLDNEVEGVAASSDLITALVEGRGEDLPVSAFPVDGTFPTGTAHLERRNLSQLVPQWEDDLCIQCGKCVYVCPHSVIRSKLVAPEHCPANQQGIKSAFKEHPDARYLLQISHQDCTGCQLCVEICPAKDKTRVGRKSLNMVAKPEKSEGWQEFLEAPTYTLGGSSVKNLQLRQPLFEFSGACAGCGETPYLRILSQLYGDRLLIANATGCSSIYGGNLPTTPWSKNGDGHGPAWCNSLFEDNAEFGLGLRLALDFKQARARKKHDLPELFDPTTEEVAERRAQVAALKDPEAEALIPHTVWIVGGDGWAYDIGFGGLDHVLAGNSRVRILVLDTEVYSNTGGQASKATPLGAVAKFAASGKATMKKDLGLLAMSYGTCYVASIAMGANESQTIKAFHEAESFPGPAIILAYSQCIAHGIDMKKGMQQQKLAVDSGAWLLYRFDPRRSEQPLQLDCKAPSRPLRDYLESEGRFRILESLHPEESVLYHRQAQEAVKRRYQQYEERARSHA